LLSAIFDEMRNMITNDTSKANITTVTKTPTGVIIIRLSMGCREFEHEVTKIFRHSLLFCLKMAKVVRSNRRFIAQIGKYGITECAF